MFPAQESSNNIRVFISYLNREPSKNIAKLLTEVLVQRFRYTVFLDANKLRPTGGVKWDDKLFDEARNTDVLLVLLQPETAQSDWVQREVDTARGANVSILPIKVSRDVDISDALNKLAINDLQYLEFEDHNLDYVAIKGSIESLTQETRRKQNEWYDNRKQLLKIKPPDNHDSSKVAFGLYEMPNVRVHIAHGDMTEMDAIDVLVNTENNYMQMARVFESDTLSSRLRYRGSLIRDEVYVVEDTVQQQLDEFIQQSSVQRPVPTAFVIATHAGHPDSALYRKVKGNRKIGARYIFHVASVSVSHDRDNKIIPVGTDKEVIACVHNTLKKILQVDAAKGVISPPKCKTHKRELKEAAEYQPIESIILPLFGAGRGGRSATVVIPAMVDGIKQFLLTYRHDTEIQSLKNIHLCIYSESDVNAAEQAFLERKFIKVGG